MALCCPASSAKIVKRGGGQDNPKVSGVVFSQQRLAGYWWPVRLPNEFHTQQMCFFLSSFGLR